MRRWMIGLAPLILLAHTLITACVSPSVLLLSQHEHWVIGKVTAAQWAVHTQWHLKQLNGHFVAGTSSITVDPRSQSEGTIISAQGCDMQAMQAFYAALRSLPARAWRGISEMAVADAPIPAQAQAQFTTLHVPVPPPRTR